MLGKPVANFSLPSTGGRTFRTSEHRCKRLALCFYPKDSEFKPLGCEMLGIPRDSLYGKKVRGIARSTLVIDDKVKLAREWRGVKVRSHVEEVLSFVKAL